MSHMIGKEAVDINEFSSQQIILVPYLSRMLINTAAAFQKSFCPLIFPDTNLKPSSPYSIAGPEYVESPE